MSSGLLFLSCSLVLLAWVISSYKPSPFYCTPTLNYDGLLFFDHSNLYSPSSEDEVVQLVRLAARDGRKMRVVGSGHSWSPVATSEDILISLCNYKGLIALEKTAGESLISVKGGTTLAEINTILEENGLAMINLGSISSQTVAGAVSTATHGSGIKFKNLADLVTRLKFVSGTGEVITTSLDGENAELFPAAAVSLGMFGIITEITLKVRGKYSMAEKSIQYRLHDCIDNLHAFVEGSEHVKFWIELHSSVCMAVFSNETQEAVRGNPSWLKKNFEVGIFSVIQHWLYLIPRMAPSVMKILTERAGLFPFVDRVDMSRNVLNIPHYFPPHSESEICVELAKCKEALLQLPVIVKTYDLPLNYIVEVRFVQGDDLWLSPHYHRDSCCITLLQYSPDGITSKLYFDAYYESTKHLHPRMHWGKYWNLTSHEIQALYERFDDFSKIRKKMDPNGLFINKFLSQTFGY